MSGSRVAKAWYWTVAILGWYIERNMRNANHTHTVPSKLGAVAVAAAVVVVVVFDSA